MGGVRHFWVEPSQLAAGCVVVDGLLSCCVVFVFANVFFYGRGAVEGVRLVIVRIAVV